MCWYSVEHAGIETHQAEIGQRLCIRKMHWDARWVVQETDLEAKKPVPVCLLDGTRVMFRPAEAEQSSLQLPPDAEAVFRMLRRPKRDVFEFEGGRQIEVNQLPAGLLFDVLVVPGKEQLSTLITEPAAEKTEPAQEEEPVLARLLRFW